MTKYRIYACCQSKVEDHWVWEVEAENEEAAQAKIEALDGSQRWAGSVDSKGNTDEVRCVETWQVGLNSDGLEFED